MNKLYSIVLALLLSFNFTMFSQTAPPWDFNGTDENFVGSNYSSVTAGDSYATYTINSPNDDGNGGSPNPNMKNTDAMIDTSVGNFIALTIKNTTGNTRVQVITTTNGSNSFTNFDGLSANDADFVTHYINMSSNGNWNGTLGTINFRFKQGGGVNNNVYSGDILFDNIEIVESIPATPRIDYTFDDTSDSEGFVTANGVTMSQVVAGELHLDIADQSPYPKLEQSGLYSVDADTYKYVQVTLVNNSPKNKLTFVSPSGGNEFSTSEITPNSSEVQTVEVDLSAFTNWSGTQASWWFQLVENPGDGATPSAGEMDIQQILFATESINPSSDFQCSDGAVSTTFCYDTGIDNIYTFTSDDGSSLNLTIDEGQVENNWDELEVRDSDGTVLYNGYGNGGDVSGLSFQSSGDSITLEVVEDGSVSCVTNGFTPITFTVSCALPQTAVTFTVNTANITVGENGMYVGGGVLGNALAYAMTDDDGDGTWEVTVNLDQGTTGNYIFLNSPSNENDWGTKEVLDGQECADPNNYNDRILPEITGDAMTIQHCFGSCESDGTCPAAADTYEVTFSVDMSNYPGGLGESDIVYLNGNFVGWCGECNPMSDDDGDGIWTVTMELEDGDYEYKFTVNGWTVQEEFGAIGAVEGCTVTDGTYTNRAVTVAGEDMVLPTVYWNLCPGETPGEVYNVTFNLDATAIDVGGNGMYMGGGILGGANAVAMSDDDGDGVWTVTLELSTDQIGGNYTFLNSPNDGGDWGAKEDISGQECADADNYNDRIVPEFSGDAEFCYVFAVCTDGVCADDPVTFPICEDFEGEDGAAGWTFIDAGGATSDWLLDTPANTGDQSIGHGYLPQDVAYNDWAVSPSYNTSGLAEGTATVSYYEYLNWSADAQAHNVYYTLDYAGDATTATWVLLTDVIGTDAEDVFVQRTFNIPSAESVVIGFQYLNTYGADWNIDDMCIDGTLSTTDTELLDMRIYPNPTSSMINVQFDRDIELTLYNMLGQEIMRTNNKQVDISALQQGNYIVIVRDLESNYVKNFNIIKK